VQLPALATTADKLHRSFGRKRRGLRMTRPVGGEGCRIPLLSSLSELSLAVMMRIALTRRMQDFEDDDIPVISGRGEGVMEEAPATGSGAARRNEDIALDLMKFVAMTTGYGRTTSTGVGFQGTGSAAKPEDYAEHLLELYGKCLGAVVGKK
jgi:hypothetical protein